MKKLFKPNSVFFVFMIACSLLSPFGALCADQPLNLQSLQHAIDAAGAQWTVGETGISHLSADEFRALCGTIPQAQTGAIGEWVEMYESPAGVALPAKIDWRDYKGKNYVTSIKRQECGDCWAFSAVATLEARLKIDTGQTLDLSEQLLVSTCCSAGDCGGGYIGQAATFMRDTGSPEESCYPYKNGNNSACAEACSNWQQTARKADSYQAVNQSVDALKSAIYNRGPVNLGFMVFSDFQNYTGGVYKYVSGKKEGGHGVVAVGYDDDQQCFIVKNSWGSNWGENGYFRIAYSEVASSDVQFGFDAHCYNGDINHSDDTLTADFTFSANNLTVAFKDASVSGGGQITSWDWNFGDGAVSGEQNPTHAYKADGVYTVTLEVSTRTLTESASKKVTVGSSQGYCDAKGEEVKYEWIAEVTVNAVSKKSSGNGYSDFTDTVMPLAPGERNPIQLTPGFDGKGYAEAWRVWIDFNQDSDFDDAGEMVFEKTSDAAVSGSIDVPAGAGKGRTRMRVAMQYQNPPKACGGFKYGEIEDYTVEIGGSSDPQYCESKGRDQKYEWIAGVSVDRYENTSKAAGYSDFTRERIDVSPGASVDVVLTPGYSDQSYDEKWQVWIDWNRDGRFDGRDEAVLQSTGSGDRKLSLTIPRDAAAGATRMRVTMSYAKEYPKDCGEFDYGETEDYTIVVGR